MPSDLFRYYFFLLLLLYFTSHCFHLNVFVACLFHLRCCNFTLHVQLYRDRSELLVGVDGDSYSEVSAGASVIAEVRAGGSCSSGGSRQCLITNFLSNPKNTRNPVSDPRSCFTHSLNSRGNEITPAAQARDSIRAQAFNTAYNTVLFFSLCFR